MHLDEGNYCNCAVENWEKVQNCEVAQQQDTGIWSFVRSIIRILPRETFNLSRSVFSIEPQILLLQMMDEDSPRLCNLHLESVISFQMMASSNIFGLLLKQDFQEKIAKSLSLSQIPNF